MPEPSIVLGVMRSIWYTLAITVLRTTVTQHAARASRRCSVLKTRIRTTTKTRKLHPPRPPGAIICMYRVRTGGRKGEVQQSEQSECRRAGECYMDWMHELRGKYG
ncbi:hypothetical protein CALCODRAFT_128229 [Calocera cornea HHB12733]|uniref:Uncharacterized protein n=1 Tax=Calocera cornea HHB12733 TaxID=1353952 RepID=A0A165IA02_9BASI|nr:hypothetical protein CALCODRAFT_128229 [Calocera cornea HHB12733]